MLNVTQKEKKCVRYLTNEMSLADRSVFEIEMSLDDDLFTIYENYQKIWFSYPNNPVPNQVVTFEEILIKYNKPIKEKSTPVSRKQKITLAMAFLLVFCLVFYFVSATQSEYTNHRIAPKGQRLTFILPDNSTVTLNSGSEVKYSSDFLQERNIWLKGEAFFKVTKNIKSPFIVLTNDFDIKVLGTQFNVNSTTINQTVSLTKGRVSVVLKESKDEINLLPNQELVWNGKTKIVIKRNFDVKKILAWKDNTLLLDDEKLEDVLPKINQFYGVHFFIKDSTIANTHVKGAFKNQTLDEFITSLEFILDVSIIKINKNNIEITMYHEN